MPIQTPPNLEEYRDKRPVQDLTNHKTGGVSRRVRDVGREIELVGGAPESCIPIRLRGFVRLLSLTRHDCGAHAFGPSYTSKA